MIQWVSVSSAAIRQVGYDSSANRLYIDFDNSDPHYTYCGVSEHLYRQFVSSSSVGSFYHQYIKDQYNC